jgi:hypothetical protein
MSRSQRRRAVQRRLLAVQVQLVERLFGTRTANRYFWVAPGSNPDWRDVRQRLGRLSAIEHGTKDQFVLDCLNRTDDPATVVGLSRHPASSTCTTAWLARAAEGLDEAIARRLRRSHVLAGAVLGAGDRLLAPGRAADLTTWVTDLHDVPDSRLFQVRDSTGLRPTTLRSERDGELGAGEPARPSRHRLVIAEHFYDPEDIALLLPGAEQITLLATSDTFGTADLLAYEAWPGVGRVTVEHTRSRISRFSREYIDLHEATVTVAERVVAHVAELPGLLEPHDVSVLTVEVADFLFFQALKVRAIEALLADCGFDHIVVTVDRHQPGDEYIQLLAGVVGLADDPRVEILSTSRSSQVRARFWRLADEIAAPTAHTYTPKRQLPHDLVVRKFAEFATELGRSLQSPARSGRSLVQVVTADVAAYNTSTNAYVSELAREFDVRVLQVGAESMQPMEGLVGRAGRDYAFDTIAVPSGPCRPLAQILLRRLRQDQFARTPPGSADERAVEWALRSTLPRLSLQALGVPLARIKAIASWMHDAQEKGTLPDAIILTPQRSPAVGSIAPAARRFGVPTIAIEPHIQDANYCRYLKISADYYGVMSDYFRQRAADGFGIELSRSRTIGSPRQVAPAGYDPRREQQLRRQQFEAETGVEMADGRITLVFFCQPSDWGHVSTVWGSILHAARATGSRVLLKTHPEETVSRAAAYVEQAAAAGMADRVVLLDVDAPTAVALADLVLTAYSTAAIDAAVRQRPVISVTEGDARYPVDLEAMVGASLVTSVDELIDVIEQYRSDPDGFECRARSLIERETQFVEGPGDRLRTFVREVVSIGAAGVRRPSEVPRSLFLDGPHSVFPV